MEATDYSCNAAEIQELDVSLLSEDVVLEEHAGDELVVEYRPGTGLGMPKGLSIDRIGPSLRLQSGSGITFPMFGRSGALQIRLPAAWNGRLKASTASGDLGMGGLTLDSAALKAASGDVRIAECSVSRLEASSTSGQVVVEKHNGGTLRAQSRSGDVIVSGALAEEASLRATSGDVRIMGRAPRASCSSTSGDVRCALESVEEFEAKSTSGDVRLALEDASGAQRLELVSTSGDVLVQVPEGTILNLSFSTISGSLRTSRARGLVMDQARGLPVRMHTTSGDGILASGPAPAARGAFAEGRDEDVHYV